MAKLTTGSGGGVGKFVLRLSAITLFTGFLLSAQSPVPGSEISPQEVASFQTVWASFRSLTLAGNIHGIAKVTRFPFTVHGLTDSDPVRQYDRGHFADVFHKLLLSEMGVGKGKAINTFVYIRKKERVSAHDFGGDSSGITLGNLVFLRVNGTWLLTEGYLDE